VGTGYAGTTVRSPVHRVRLVSASIAVLVTAAGCGGSEPGMGSRAPSPRTGDPASIAALQQGAVELSLLVAQSNLRVGPSTFVFGLVTADGGLVTGGSLQVHFAKDANTPAEGPIPATFHTFSAFERFPNEAPRSELTGFYSVDVEISEPGNWLFAGVADVDSKQAVGVGAIVVTDAELPGQVGTKALSVPTPVGHTDAELRAICTREPPDPMHSISLDDALSNGKPTVVNFGTPLLCASRMCGPVVDETLAVFEDVGAERANFIHVEIYPDRDQNHPAEPFTAYGFQSEPFTLVIDRDGVIRTRFEGPVTADMIEEALTPLL
jgi:hypothetical protein